MPVYPVGCAACCALLIAPALLIALVLPGLKIRVCRSASVRRADKENTPDHETVSVDSSYVYAVDNRFTKDPDFQSGDLPPSVSRTVPPGAVQVQLRGRSKQRTLRGDWHCNNGFHIAEPLEPSFRLAIPLLCGFFEPVPCPAAGGFYPIAFLVRYPNRKSTLGSPKSAWSLSERVVCMALCPMLS